MDIQHAYAKFLNDNQHAKGWPSAFDHTDKEVGYEGVTSDNVAQFLGHYGFGLGYNSVGDYTHSTFGDAGILLLDNGPLGGHAVNITGMADSTHYYYYDAQPNNTQTNDMGTIATNDSRIYGVYGHQ